MRHTGNGPALPTAVQLGKLQWLAEQYADAIRRSPYDAVTGAWKPSELLPADDPARVEPPAPLATRRRSVGLLGIPLDLSKSSSPVYRVDNERRHRVALRAQFEAALRSNTAYKLLDSSPEFRRLLKSFRDAHDRPLTNGRLGAPDAYARFIAAVAMHLMLFRGGRMRVATAEVRQRAAKLIDKLLDLRKEGVSPPFIGVVSQPDGGTRFASLTDELDRWRTELRSDLPPSRQRSQRNDAFVRHRFALDAFRDHVERDFGSPKLSRMLAGDFAALIGYRNPAAQVSR